MQKRILSLGGAAIALAIIISALTFRAEKSTASTLSGINVAALNEAAFGECTGPRPQNGNCESRNTNKCSDTAGCNSGGTER
ncbi:hypothetical protein [Chitinophaga solisilvae]|uniref:Uncharacterized protein n=1 Tax=Chitinophaga solisilvae TaxID=1233460 RepID=A0A9Q5DC77_9BACT|nr:hypothetical protein [Chitinophaga solisilvae]NSL88817.1 hypothetical protein [Chitinophaga solisilvae]